MRVDARRGVLAALSAARGASWRYRCVRVELRTLVCGSRSGVAVLADGRLARAEVSVRDGGHVQK